MCNLTSFSALQLKIKDMQTLPTYIVMQGVGSKFIWDEKRCNNNFSNVNEIKDNYLLIDVHKSTHSGIIIKSAMQIILCLCESMPEEKAIQNGGNHKLNPLCFIGVRLFLDLAPP